MARESRGQAPKLQEIVTEVKELLEGRELLERIFYRELGPYGDGKLTQETRNDLQNYFGFDDGE
jgi:hypothetical protein